MPDTTILNNYRGGYYVDNSPLDNAILDSLSIGVYYVDTDLKILRMNKATQDITGYDIADLYGRSCEGNLLCRIEKTSEPLCAKNCPLKATIKDGVHREALAFIRNKAGDRIPVKAETKPVILNECIVGAVAVLNRSDVADKTKDDLVDVLTKTALTDPLTGVYNRSCFEGEVNVIMSKMLLNKNKYGIFFMDIDNFSHINNNYGHETGDRVLIEMTRAITSSVRKADMFCRWGGEEFVGIFQVRSFDGLGTFGDKVIEAIRSVKINHEGENIGITASIGITGVRPEDTLDSVVKRADELMYNSKKTGKNKYTIG